MLKYWNRQDNPATFETLKEVREHAVAVTEKLSGGDRFRQILNPKLEDYPEGLVYIYRSPDLYGGQTAARNNTTFIVFPEKRFETKDEARAYLEGLGLIRMIDEAVGTILLEMPEKAGGYSEADRQHCYVLHNALLRQKAMIEIDGERCIPAESEYCGGYGKTYMFGIGAGATFMNDFIAGSRDELIGRIAGYFTYGGTMSDASAVTCCVPAFLVNPCDTAVRRFRDANGTNAYRWDKGVASFYDQAIPFREVRTAKDTEGKPGYWMERAFREMFIFLQRSSNLPARHPEPAVANAYQGYVASPAVPAYALSPRNPIFSGRTVVGDLEVIFRYDADRFSDVKTVEGERTVAGDYLDTWYEVLPQCVLNNTAPAHSVPLLLANHGGGDDHLMFLDETGILLTAGREQFAIVAPMHSGITVIAGEVFPRLVKYMLDTYPALDPERVWVTGYSMGGMATYNCINAHPEVFAAACPMAMPLRNLPEGTEKLYENTDLPAMIVSSTFDFAAWDAQNNHLNEGGLEFLQTYCRFNGIDPVEAFDFVNYPVIGRPYDSFSLTTVNGEWRNGEWLIDNAEGVPMVGLNVTEYLQHSLWPGYGDICYNFFRHYRRCAETGKIVYTE